MRFWLDRACSSLGMDVCEKKPSTCNLIYLPAAPQSAIISNINLNTYTRSKIFNLVILQLITLKNAPTPKVSYNLTIRPMIYTYMYTLYVPYVIRILSLYPPFLSLKNIHIFLLFTKDQKHTTLLNRDGKISYMGP